MHVPNHTPPPLGCSPSSRLREISGSENGNASDTIRRIALKTRYSVEIGNKKNPFTFQPNISETIGDKPDGARSVSEVAPQVGRFGRTRNYLPPLVRVHWTLERRYPGACQGRAPQHSGDSRTDPDSHGEA